MKCGICGDDEDDPLPRNNENGGLYGLGLISRLYKVNDTVGVTVNLEVEHRGYFEFHLCNLDDGPETEERFQTLNLENGSVRFPVNESIYHFIKVRLPKNLTCDHCVLRWHYKSGKPLNLFPYQYRSIHNLSCSKFYLSNYSLFL